MLSQWLVFRASPFPARPRGRCIFPFRVRQFMLCSRCRILPGDEEGMESSSRVLQGGAGRRLGPAGPSYKAGRGAGALRSLVAGGGGREGLIRLRKPLKKLISKKEMKGNANVLGRLRCRNIAPHGRPCCLAKLQPPLCGV